MKRGRTINVDYEVEMGMAKRKLCHAASGYAARLTIGKRFLESAGFKIGEEVIIERVNTRKEEYLVIRKP